MDSPTNRIDELLSGMLDGVLSEADSSELGRAMAKNPSIEAQLDELAAIKKALMSGRSTKALRPDFAGSVTLAAKKRAAEMGGRTPEWLLSDDSEQRIKKTLAPSISVRGRSVGWIFAGALSLAAIVAFVLFTGPKLEPQGIVLGPDVSKLEQNKVVSKDPSSEPETGADLLDGRIAKSDVQVERKPPGPEGPAVTIPAVTIPAVTIPAVTIPAETLTAETSLSPKENSTKFEVAANLPETAPKTDALVKSATSPPPLRNENPTKSMKPYYMVVLDISLDQQAVENRVLERILEKYGIVYTDDLVLNAEQIETLEKSQWVGNRDNIKRGVGDIDVPEKELANSKTSGIEEKMGVLFLRSTAKRLGSAVQEIAFDSVDFPDFAMDMLDGGDPARLLVEQLSSIQVAESSDGFAGRLQHPTARGNPSPFTASSSRANPMSPASRGKFKGASIAMLPEHMGMSNILILLRPAKK